jgi:hypothetical protein
MAFPKDLDDMRRFALNPEKTAGRHWPAPAGVRSVRSAA